MSAQGGDESLDCLGIDVAKQTFDAAFAEAGLVGGRDRLRGLPAASFARTPEGVAELVAWLVDLRGAEREDAVRVVMEATGAYSAELAGWLLEAQAGFRPAIVNPDDASHHRKSFALRSNTDVLAARALALYGLERRPREYEPMTEERQTLRALSRLRDDRVLERTALKNRMKEPCSLAFVREENERMLGELNGAIARIEQEMKKHLKKHPELDADVKCMMTMHGVGFLTAVSLLAELGDIRAFGRARKLTAYAGLNPSQHESGTSVRKRPRMSKKGNGRVRNALYLAAMAAIRKPNEMQAMYRRLIASGKERMAALAAVMRKMLTILRAMLIHGTPYEPCGKLRGKITSNHQLMEKTA